MLIRCIRRARALLGKNACDPHCHRDGKLRGTGLVESARAIAALILLASLLASPAMAQTTVSGAITTDTRWTMAGAPYLVTGDVSVQNNAVLSIDPGVTVYMAATTGLTVQSGSVRAMGTAAEPVRVLSDKTRLGQVAAPGDFGKWTFNANAEPSLLEHVRFESGSGLAVNGASPVFNYLDIRNNQGAAISVDLESGAVGVGNRASGNTINGIAVPQGEITDSARWGLRGIPYVVQSGVVSVGRAPIISAVSPGSLIEGETTVVTVTGTRLSGISKATSSIEGLELTVQPGATDSQAAIAVTVPAAAESNVGNLKLLTAAGDVEKSEALTILPSQPVLTSVAPSAIYRGQTQPQVTLQGRNIRAESKLLMDGVEVETLSTNATSLVARLPTQSSSGSRTLKLRTPDSSQPGQFFESNALTLAVQTASIDLTGSLSLLRGESSDVQLSIPYAAPAGGIAIALAANPSSNVELPSTVVVPQDQTTVGFTVRALSAGSGKVTASAPNFNSDFINYTIVNPPHLTVQSAAPAHFEGNSYPLRIAASSVAGVAGLHVTLTSTNPAVVAIPAAIDIAEGLQEAIVQMTTGIPGTAEVRAESGGFELGALQVTVNADSLQMPSGIWVETSASRTIPLSIGRPAPAGGLQVALSVSTPGRLSVPATVTVPEGQTSVDVPVTGVNDDIVNLTATAPNYSPVTVPVRVIGSYSLEWDSGQIAYDLYVPVGQTLDYAFTIGRQVPQADLAFSMVSSNPAIASASSSTIISQANGGSGTLSLTGLASGQVTVTLSAPGMRDRTVRVIVLKNPELRFTRTEQVVGANMYTADQANSIGLYVDGQPYTNNNNYIRIKFNFSQPGIDISPLMYVLPSGDQSHPIPIHGPSTVPSGPVTVDAVAKGFASPTQKLTLTVVRPKLEFSYLPLQRYVGDGTSSGTISFTVPGDTSGYSQRLRVWAPVELSLAHEPGANSGVQLQSTSALVSQGNNGAFVGFTAPTSAGSYTVSATSTLADPVTAGPVVVTDSEYRLGFTDENWYYYPGFEMVLGRGLTRTVNVFRLRNGEVDWQATQPLTVSLRCVPAEACSVTPATVTMEGGNESESFTVTYLAETAGVTPVVEASAQGYPTLSMPVKVVGLVPQLRGLDKPRSVLSDRDGFIVELKAANGDYLGYSRPTTPIRLDLSIVDANPTNLVDGFLGYPGGYGNGGYGPLDHFDLTELSSGVYQDWNNEYTLYVAAPTQAGSYKVRASIPGASATSTAVTVQPRPTIHFSNDEEVTVGRGLMRSIYVHREVDGEQSNLGTQTVQWTCTPVEVCEVDAQSQISDGDSSTSVRVRGKALTGETPAILRASSEGSPAIELPITVVNPILRFQDLSPSRDLVDTQWDYFYVSLMTPDGRWGEAQPGFQVKLEVVDADPANVVGGIGATSSTPLPERTFPLSTYGEASAYVAPANAVGSYRIKASVVATPDVGGAPIEVEPITSGTVQVVEDSYAIRVSSTISVGVGFTTGIYIEHKRNGNYYSTNVPKTVHLSCVPTSKCRVPATAVIGAYNGGVSVQVEGLASTDGEPATLTVTPDGYGPERAVVSTVSVVAPHLSIDIPVEQYTDTSPVWFYVGFAGPDGEYVGQPKNEMSLSWQLVDANPPGIVSVVRMESYTDEGTGQEVISYIPVDELFPDEEYLLSTTHSAGSYRLRVFGDGANFLSEPVTVFPASGELTLEPDEDHIELNYYDSRPEYAKVTRQIDGTEHMPNAPLTLTLTCVSTWGCSVPPTVTIPAGESGVSFGVERGQGREGDEGVIEVSADGYPTVTIDVSVVEEGS